MLSIGVLSLFGKLDYETITTHVLEIEVGDGGIGGENEMFDTAQIIVNVQDVNEFEPVFVNGTDLEVTLTEEAEHKKFLKVFTPP